MEICIVCVELWRIGYPTTAREDTSVGDANSKTWVVVTPTQRHERWRRELEDTRGDDANLKTRAVAMSTQRHRPWRLLLKDTSGGGSDQELSFGSPGCQYQQTVLVTSNYYSVPNT